MNNIHPFEKLPFNIEKLDVGIQKPITEIAQSKTKIFWILLLGIVMTSLAIWIAFFVPFEEIPRRAILVKAASYAGLLLFGTVTILMLKRLFSNKQGVQIFEKGFIDNSNVFNIGIISWNDVTKITTQEVMSNKFVLVHVKNPEYYMNKVSGIKKNLLKGNFKTYGTPISVVHTSLKVSHKELYELLYTNWEKYKT